MIDCEICQQPSSVHVTEIDDGSSRERHFCARHAEEYLGPGFYGRVTSPYDLSSLPGPACERLARAIDAAELAAGNPTRAADLAGAVPGLIALLSDEEASLRYFAATWLGGIGSAEAVDALRAATNDANVHVRDAARQAIEKIEAD